MNPFNKFLSDCVDDCVNARGLGPVDSDDNDSHSFVNKPCSRGWIGMLPYKMKDLVLIASKMLEKSRHMTGQAPFIKIHYDLTPLRAAELACTEMDVDPEYAPLIGFCLSDDTKYHAVRWSNDDDSTEEF